MKRLLAAGALAVLTISFAPGCSSTYSEYENLQQVVEKGVPAGVDTLYSCRQGWDSTYWHDKISASSYYEWLTEKEKDKIDQTFRQAWNTRLHALQTKDEDPVTCGEAKRKALRYLTILAPGEVPDNFNIGSGYLRPANRVR